MEQWLMFLHLVLRGKLLIHIHRRHPKMVGSCMNKKKNTAQPEVCTSEILNSLFSLLFLVVLLPLQASEAYHSSCVNSIAPGYPTWEEASVLVINAVPGSMPSENEYNYLGVEGLSIIYSLLCVWFPKK